MYKLVLVSNNIYVGITLSFCLQDWSLVFGHLSITNLKLSITNKSNKLKTVGLDSYARTKCYVFLFIGIKNMLTYLCAFHFKSGCFNKMYF